ncbi:MAG TPA: hypothetical protein DDY41_17250, partial [Arthrobacter bacterium]|nr:hypothetical protein [Arthrobacter sp.]
MKWLEQAPRVDTAVQFGRPWAQGELDAAEVPNVTISDPVLAHEARPLAYWPDGTVKWTAHAVLVPAGTEAEVLEPSLATDVTGLPSRPLAVSDGGGIRVDTGAFAVTIAAGAKNSGSAALTDAFVAPDGRQLGDALRLVVNAPDAQASVES